MATDATGTPTSLGIPTFNVDVDSPSGLGFNAAMGAIDTLISERPKVVGAPSDGQIPVWDAGSGAWVPNQLIDANIAASANILRSKLAALDAAALFGMPVAQSIPNNAWTAVGAGSGVLFASGSTTGTVPTFRITTSADGWYLITLNVQFDPNGSGGRATKVDRFSSADALLETQYVTDTTSAGAGISEGATAGSVVTHMSAGDYVRPSVFQSSGIAINLNDVRFNVIRIL